MGNRIKQILARRRRKKELAEKGIPNDIIQETLINEGYYEPSVKTQEEHIALEEHETPTPLKNIESNPTTEPHSANILLKVWCSTCARLVTPLNQEITTREIKTNSFRTFLKGNCPACSRKVGGIIKSQQ